MRKRTVRKKKQYKAYKTHDLDSAEQYSLCDAIRYADKDGRFCVTGP